MQLQEAAAAAGDGEEGGGGGGATAEEQEGDEACLRRVEPRRPGSRGVAGLHHQDRVASSAICSCTTLTRSSMFLSVSPGNILSTNLLLD